MTITKTQNTFEVRKDFVRNGYTYIVDYNPRVEKIDCNGWGSECRAKVVDITGFNSYEEAKEFKKSLRNSNITNLEETRVQVEEEQKKREKAERASKRRAEREYAKKNEVFQEKIKEMNTTEEAFLEETRLAEEKVREARELLERAYSNLQFYYNIDNRKYRRLAENLK